MFPCYVRENPDCQTSFLAAGYTWKMCPDSDVGSDTLDVPELQFNSETESNTYTVCKSFGDDDDKGLQKKYKQLPHKN